MRRGAGGALALLALTLAAAPAPAAERVLARETQRTAVSAYSGSAVWSSWSERLRRFRLVAWDRKRGRRVLRVAPSRAPFDADLGPGRDGRVTVVYSRCKRTPTNERSSNSLPTYVSGRGCDIYQLPLAGGEERRIDRLSRGDASEVLPTIWRTGVAFARVYERRSGLEGILPHLILGSTRSGEPSRELPGGTRGVYEDVSLGEGPPDYDGGPGPVGIDFDGKRVAYTWSSQADSCKPGDEGDIDHLHAEVWVDDVGGSHRLVEETCEGETDFFFSPALSPDRLFYYRRLNVTSFGGRFRAFDFASGAFSESGAGRRALALAWGGDALYYSRSASGGRTEIVRDADLAFAPSG